MDTLLIERNNRLFLANTARVVRAASDVTEDFAAAADWEFDTKSGSPFIKWIAGDFVEADNPNQNKQFWTKDDLAMGEYSIKYAPLNMLHKQRQPVGFFASTRTIDLSQDKASTGTAKIEALSGLWSHIFPFESAVVDQADEAGSLFYSMEVRGTHVHCAGENGCDKQFEYMKPEDHCSHIKERTSIRHIVNPTFRGGALIIPPVKPGWASAHANVYEQAIRDEASRYAELTEVAYRQVTDGGSEVSPAAWEHLMATVISMSDR